MYIQVLELGFWLLVLVGCWLVDWFIVVGLCFGFGECYGIGYLLVCCLFLFVELIVGCVSSNQLFFCEDQWIQKLFGFGQVVIVVVVRFREIGGVVGDGLDQCGVVISVSLNYCVGYIVMDCFDVVVVY